jgi:peptidoglycan/LPS O-acetylase OafA/YrhL
MRDDQFITRPMSVCLDLVRAAAAFVVLIGHAAQLRIYTGPYPFTTMLQHNAVVVFFVLSGLVISSSVRHGKVTLKSYTIARIARILPVSLPALAFSAAVFGVGKWMGAPNINPPGYDILSLKSAILPIFFLSESAFGSGPVANPPYWSLCYEIWFYALFGAALFLRGKTRLMWIAMFAVLAGTKILLLLPIWLVGVWLAHSKIACRAPLWLGIVLIILSAASFPVATAFAPRAASIFEWYLPLNRGFSFFVASDSMLAVTVALGFIGLRPIAMAFRSLLSKYERPVRSLAGFSFTLYLLHWPILCLLRLFNVTSGTSIPAFVALLLLIAISCAAVAGYTERRRGAVRAFLEAAMEAAPVQSGQTSQR